MNELVLAVRGAELQPPENFDDLRMQAGYTRIVSGLFAGFDDRAVHFLLLVLENFLNMCRVDAPIQDQFGERSAWPLPVRTGSKQEMVTASGVSSTITSTPAACSKAWILRPLRPMMRPFISSEGIFTTEVVTSATWSDATRWMAAAISLRARLSPSSRASVSICRMMRAISARASFSTSASSTSRAHHRLSSWRCAVVLPFPARAVCPGHWRAYPGRSGAC